MHCTFFGKSYVSCQFYTASPAKRDTSKEDAELAESDDDDEEPESPSDVKENIKCKFLVEMPEDFYHFWDFAKSINPADPKSKNFCLCTFMMLYSDFPLCSLCLAMKTQTIPSFVGWKSFYSFASNLTSM